jgi:hypothetical protein
MVRTLTGFISRVDCKVYIQKPVVLISEPFENRTKTSPYFEWLNRLNLGQKKSEFQIEVISSKNEIRTVLSGFGS